MEGMKNFFKKLKWDSIIVSILALVLGILCVCLPSTSGDVLCIMFGCSLIAIGLTLFIKFFAIDAVFRSNLIVFAAILFTLGLFCLIYPNLIKGIITVLFGLFIIMDSAASLSDSIACKDAKVKGWFWLFLLSAITLALGIAVMFSSFETIMIFAGISLILEGIKRLIITLTFSHKIKEARKQIIDTFWVD